MEIVELDPKDKEIAELKKQIASMQDMIINQNKPEIQNQIIETENKSLKKINRPPGFLYRLGQKEYIPGKVQYI